MKFRLSCVIDANLIGPLTELIAPYGQVSIKAVEDGAVTPPPPPPQIPLVMRKHRRVPLFAPRKGVGTITVLRAVAAEGDIPAIKAAMVKVNVSPGGSSATLSKLKRHGYVSNPSVGVWRLTLKGETALRKVEGYVAVPKGAENGATAK